MNTRPPDPDEPSIVAKLAEHHPTVLRVGILSDFHVHHDEATHLPYTNYARDMSSDDPSHNPVTALRDLIAKEPIELDLLLCPGDITDQAHPGALAHGWQILNDLGRQMKAITVIGTAGNHDIDSRYSFADFDAKGAATSLTPSFPVSERQLADQYWARHFCILRGANYRIVVLNSAAYHGEGRAFNVDGRPSTAVLPEYEHGRISSRTLAALRRALEADQAAPCLNILLCHHHPAPIDGLAGADHMENGQALLDLLSEPRSGRWLVVHGHRHLAAVQRPGATAINAAATVFCAGSFGKVLPSGWPSSNQFYQIDLLTEPQSVGLSIAGRFRAWSWARLGTGFHPASFNERLPGRGGFGFLGELSDVATALNAAMELHGVSLLPMDEAVLLEPRLPYVAPGDWALLRHHLAAFRIRVSEDQDDGEISFTRRT